MIQDLPALPRFFLRIAGMVLLLLCTGIGLPARAGNTATGSSSSTGANIPAGTGKTSATVTLSAAGKTTVGQAITLTGTVTGHGPTGSVLLQTDGKAGTPVPTSAGKASLAFTPTQAGSHVLAAVYSGDGSNTSATSIAQTVTVAPSTSTATVGVSSASVTLPQSIPLQLSATIKGYQPGGSVRFLDGSSLLGTANVIGGNATLAATVAGAGSHKITVSYGGDSNNLASTSSAVTVNALTTPAITVAPITAALTAGKSVVVSASVTGSSPTGQVTLMMDGKAGIAVPLAAGKANLPLLLTTSGTHSVVVNYSGDSFNVAAVSAPQTLTVAASPSAITLAAAKATVNIGATTVALATTVTGDAPTGTVTILEGTTVIATAALSGGQASISVGPSTLGSHNYVARYSGDGNNLPGQSVAQTITVLEPATTTLLIGVPASGTSMLPYNLQVSVTGNQPTGTVRLQMDGRNLASPSASLATLTQGSANLSVVLTGSGTHTLTAVYSGDSNNAPSTSTGRVISLNKHATTLTLESAVKPVVTNANTLFAVVAHGNSNGSGPTGAVTVSEGGVPLFTGTLSPDNSSSDYGLSASNTDAFASFITPLGKTGTHTLTASYAGDSSYSPSTVTLTLPVGTATPAGGPLNNIGLNAGSMNYYSGAYATADLVRGSEFRTQDMAAETAETTDANGDPLADFRLIVSSFNLAAGDYAISFSGQATLSGIGTVSNQIYNPASNTTTAKLTVAQELSGNQILNFSNTLRSPASTSNDGVTNLQIWRPGYSAASGQLFTNEFIAAMRSARVIRTMDYLATNINDSTTWSDRPLMTYQGTNPGQPCTLPLRGIQATCNRGEPWELIVALANATGDDLWLNIPVNADNDYVAKLIDLLRFGSDGVEPYTAPQVAPVYPPLNPNSRIYLEYGNEMWNTASAFHTYWFGMNLACEEAQSQSSPLNYDGLVNNGNINATTSLCSNPQINIDLAMQRWYAYRSTQISLMFRAAYGDTAMMGAIRPVLSRQAGDANWYLSEALQWAEGYYGSFSPVARQVSDLWWAAGGATYYTSDVDPKDASPATMSAYFAAFPDTNFKTALAIDVLWAHAYGLHMASYEGGPAPAPAAADKLPADTANAIAQAYNTDPRMGPAMVAAYDVFRSYGGDEFNFFGYAGAEPWTFIDAQSNLPVSDTTSVKMQALQTIGERTAAAVTIGTAMPGVLTFSPANGTTKPAVTTSVTKGVGYQYTAATAKYPVSFYYGLKAVAGVDSAHLPELLVPVRLASAGTFHIHLVGVYSVGSEIEVKTSTDTPVSLSAADSTSGTITTNTAAITLPAGLTVLRLRPLKGTFDLTQLVIQ